MNEVDVNTVATRKQYLRRSFRPNFERKKQLFNGAIAIKKAIYNVTSILDLSKVLMLGFTTIILKINMVIKSKHCQQILIVLCIKLELKMFMKTSTMTSVIILKIQNITIIQTT